MFGGNVPPPPPPIPVPVKEGGSYGGIRQKYTSEERYLLDREREFKIKEEDDKLIEILKMWAKWQ